MSTTFFVTLVVALLAVFYWRVVVMVAIAVLLAFVLTGISAVSDVMAGQEGEHTVVIAPGDPAPQPDGVAPDAGGEAVAPEGGPPVQGEQPS